MLNETDVIKSVVKHLERHHWCIDEVSLPDKQGFDILARKGDSSIVIEAKGETSSKPGTKRYGQPFDAAQRNDHVSKAFYKAARVVSDGEHQAGIALPVSHEKLIENIAPALKKLKIITFWVSDGGSVREAP